MKRNLNLILTFNPILQQILFMLLTGCFLCSAAFGQMAGQAEAKVQHPNLLFKPGDQAALRLGVKQYPLFKASYEKLEKKARQAMKSGIVVPVPKGQDGSFSHNQHKKNYMDALACAVSYHISGDTTYGGYVRDLLLAYTALYEDLPIHPDHVPGHAAGKIFWQNLNDCVWQVYMIQAYDCVYDMLTPAQRSNIETHLFTPIVHFLMVDNKAVFDQIHNHGTWNDAAVGLTGYVMGRKDLVNKAIYGSNLDSKTGFLAQINTLFSPDGYYTEGPYYQRYALMPFMVFAMAIQQYQPDVQIFKYRDSLLNKSVNTCLQLSYNKHLFPFNDDIKDKTYVTEELVYGVDIAYNYGHQNPGLLQIAQDQKALLVSGLGLRMAQDIAQGKTTPYDFKSAWYNDGADGKKGGIGVLRHNNKAAKTNFAAAIKATSLGMGHGHFDKLNLLVYDNQQEIIPDYGSVRYINIASKEGGRYLPENNSWAKQTIAHNTVTVDQTSNYKGKRKAGEDKYSYLVYQNLAGSATAVQKNAQSDPANKARAKQGAKANLKEQQKVKLKSGAATYQVISCADTTAYSGVKMQRTIILLSTHTGDKNADADPLLLDIFNLTSDEPHQYDLPYYYNGEIIDQNMPINWATKKMEVYGNKQGYQYLWKTGAGDPAANPTTKGKEKAANKANEINKANHSGAFTFLQAGKFYTLTSTATQPLQYDLVMTGASDPNHNLRAQKGIIESMRNQKDAVFVNVLEPHGRLDYSSETTKGASSRITNLKITASSPGQVSLWLETGRQAYRIVLHLNDTDHFIDLREQQID